MTGYSAPFDPPREMDMADYQCGTCGHSHMSHDAWGCVRCECKERTHPEVPGVPE